MLSRLGGVDGQADHTARYAACVGKALEPAGFGDIDGNFAEDAVNCLAYYGITRGTSDGRFAPGNSVTRWQMALFLVRAAEAAGLALPAARDQGFEDIGELGSAAQEAVNQLAQMEVTRGTAVGRFSPYGLVTRQQMALFLYRFLELVPIGEGGVMVRTVTPDDRVFDDVGSLSDVFRDAILVLYEMGVTAGTLERRFSPSSRVSRGQMAVFIARALAHSNVRPAGVTIQLDRGIGRADVGDYGSGVSGAGVGVAVPAGDTIDLHFSVRDDERMPMDTVPLDIFKVSPRLWSVAFDARGNCAREVKAVFTGQLCQIDRLDLRTDELGNLFVSTELSESTVFWAWTGAQNELFRDGVTKAGLIEITVTRPAVSLVVRDDMRRDATRLLLEDSVAFTMQMVDAGGEDVEESGVGVRVSYRLDVAGVRGRSVVRTIKTDESGRVRLAFPSQDDPAVLTMEVSAQGLTVVDRTVSQLLTGENGVLRWVEEGARPSKMRVRPENAYHLASADGPGVVHQVIATLTDQYGIPVEGAQLEFSSDDSRGGGGW